MSQGEKGVAERLSSRFSDARMVKLWDVVRTSFWAVPALMMLGAFFLSAVIHTFDGNDVVAELAESGWLYGGSADGAREILATIAGSMITIAGVVFSITVVVLTLASSQFGPRVLRTFMDDRGNQVVLGTFTGTFLFCILGLRLVDTTLEEPFVPHLTVTVGVALAVASLGVLIYFIHHMAASIQAPRVVERVGRELDRAVERVVVEPGEGAPGRAAAGREGEPADRRQRPDPPPADAFAVRAPDRGYVQAVDLDALAEVAETRGLVVQVHRDAGSWVLEGTVVASAWPREAVDPDAERAVEKAFVTGRRRTPVQDVSYAFEQLTEIAVRALSPGINDPFTARTCVYRSSAGLARVLACGEPPAVRTDGSGAVRVVVPPLRFDGLVRAAWDPIRQNARGSTIVLAALLDAAADLAERARSQEHRTALLRQVELALAHGEREIPEPREREDVDRRGRAVLASLRGG